MMHGKAIWKSENGEIAKPPGVFPLNPSMEAYSAPYKPPNCKGQCVDARWVVASGHKTQSFMKTEVSKSAWTKHCLLRQLLSTIYKSPIRLHLDYGDAVYDQPHNETFWSKLESVRYDATLAITEAICGTSQVKLHVKVGLEFLKARGCFRWLCYFHKFISYGLLPNLFQLIPQESHSYNTRNSDDSPTYYCVTDSVKSPFYPWAIREWNKIDLLC